MSGRGEGNPIISELEQHLAGGDNEDTFDSNKTRLVFLSHFIDLTL